MSTSERKYHIATFPSLIMGLYFAQVHNMSRTRVVHETGLYESAEYAESAAIDWTQYSKSKLAQSLETQKE